MKALQFELSRHSREVASWASQWNLFFNPEFLPRTGRIVPGKAVIFLYKTDSAAGFIENLICNPQEDKKSVSEAIDACVSAIEKDAKEMNIRLLVCSTSLNSVKNRALNSGYTVVGGNLTQLAKEIK